MLENFSFSQSSLQDYADCPRRFQLRYLEQLSYPANEFEQSIENEKHLLEGQQFHRLVQQALIGIPTENLTKMANTPTLARWWENFLNFSQTSLTGMANLHPEVSLSAPLGKFRLMAKYDLIASKKDKVIIYDWKTYRKRPRNEWLSSRWQTRVYRALLVAAGSKFNHGKPIVPERCEMVYWFANFPDEPSFFTYSDVQNKRDWDALTRLIKEIESATDSKSSLPTGFPQTENRQTCTYCPYRSYCDRGVQAGDFENVGVEKDEEAVFDVNFEQIGEIEF
jgi:CRISPR/Cas system-associated exonuclease Cas4 (RecB family)